MKIHFVLILSLFNLNSFSQSDLDKVEIITKGKINCKLIYNQYFDTINIANSIFSPWSFELRESIMPEKLYIVFENRFDDNYDLLFIEGDSSRTKMNVIKDSITCCVLKPLLVSRIPKRYQKIKVYNWTFINEITDPGCQDTHYSNLEVSNGKGKVKFKNLNNITVYEYYSQNKTSWIIISTRLCREQMIIYKIE